MDRYVAFVDVGFLKAASASALGKSVRAIKPKPEAWVSFLRALGEKIPGEPTFLRIYWYDGAYDPRHPRYQAQRKYFDSIADVPGVQIRLGHLRVEKSPSWQYAVKAALKKLDVSEDDFAEHFKFKPKLEQKGVDTRITLDMVRLAQRGVYSAGILIAGDRDLAEPLRVAQDEGCRMFVMIPEGGGLAPELAQLADEVAPVSKAELELLFEIEE